MRRILPFKRLLGVSLSLWAVLALAVDPPHATTNLCASCHLPHFAPGGGITTVGGNPNLCMSCHQPGGTASSQPFAESDQALPWPGLPAGVTAAGTSHRWDASAAGHVAFLGGATTPSTGTLMPVGTFTGAYAKTYTLTIVSAGPVGTATFNWAATTPGGGAGANVLTGANVPLDQGVSVTFLDGSAPSFQAGDKWNLYAMAGLRQPTNTTILARMSNGVVVCSACHNEHNQAQRPFDPVAPAYGGPGTGAGRHFMRANNDRDQLCVECHVALQVTNATAGSHPVGIGIPATADYRRPALLPLEATTTNLGCLTCHTPHYSPAGDGRLLRPTNSVAGCVDCHLQSDTLTPAAHLAATNSATLWPGGRYGSLMPARTSPADRGTCLNCHALHGWPDAANPANRYPTLLADAEENLCFTCHGTIGPAVKQVGADFAKLRHHPVRDSEQMAGRKVECTDCHNAHMAQSGGHVYTNTATATRNRVSGPLRGVPGVAVDYTGLGNFVAPAR